MAPSPEGGLMKPCCLENTIWGTVRNCRNLQQFTWCILKELHDTGIQPLVYKKAASAECGARTWYKNSSILKSPLLLSWLFWMGGGGWALVLNELLDQHLKTITAAQICSREQRLGELCCRGISWICGIKMKSWGLRVHS